MQQRKVLQIDDEPAISAALNVRLRAAGFSVIAEPDGPSGLAAAGRHHPQAILLDVHMPGMDGLEVCRRLRANASTAHIPVIFLSANLEDDAKRAALEAGGTAYLTKPYDAQEVIAALEAAVESNAGR